MYISQGISLSSFQNFFLKSITTLGIVSLIGLGIVKAQIADNFSDNNFNSNPTWTGSDAKFIVVGGQLKLSAPVVNDNAYLSTTSSSISNGSWEFLVRMDFNPSSTNFARFYLSSDQTNLTSNLNGYFVMVGNTTDEVSLYRQDGVVRTKIIDGLDGRLNLSTFSARIKVTRTSAGQWQLFCDVGIDGSYEPEGTVTDNTHQTSAFAGIYCEYTSTRSDKFFFDDVVVTGDAVSDHTPPEVTQLNILSSTRLEILFNEDIDPGSVLITNFYLTDGLHPSSGETSPDKIILSFDKSFINGVEDTLSFSGIKDIAGNEINPAKIQFLFFEEKPVSRFDVLINEILADYSPTVGLPEAEFVELHNRSVNAIDLHNWKLTDGNSVASFPSKILLPGEYVTVTSNASVNALSVYGKVIGLSNFPTLNNSADYVIVTDDTGVAIDSLYYESSWYGDEDKKDGGWSMERIDPEDFCTGSGNWNASVSPNGGTPSSKNSIYRSPSDTAGPLIETCQLLSSGAVQIEFNEKLSVSPPLVSAEPAISVDFALREDLRAALLWPDEMFDARRSYLFTLKQVEDCRGNITPEAYVYLNNDTIAPHIRRLQATSGNEVLLDFSEAIDSMSASNLYHYRLNGEETALKVIPYDSGVSLTFASHFRNGHLQNLFISGVADLNGNVTTADTSVFYFQRMPTLSHDVAITEIYADPSPTNGLPEYEYVEIVNRSSNPIDLKDWTLSDRTTTAILPTQIVLPNEYVVLAPVAAIKHLNAPIKIGLVTFPSLNNLEDVIFIRDETQKAIDSIAYRSSWYRDAAKNDGGWSLEKINPHDWCSDSEGWRASLSENGGTPGIVNSVFDIRRDTVPPRLLSVMNPSDTLIILQFNERLSVDSSVSISITPALKIASQEIRGREVLISAEIEKLRTYKIHVDRAYDCPTNLIDSRFATATIQLDTIPPGFVDVNVVSDHELEILFPEDILSSSISSETFTWKGVGAANSFQKLSETRYRIGFTQAFPNGVNQELVADVSDINGNTAQPAHSFLFFYPQPVHPKDVSFSELFPDPSPVVGLPEGEFVELINRSTNPVQLAGWKITDGSTFATIPQHILLPGDFVILTHRAYESAYSAFGKTVALSVWPSLNNGADTLQLISTTGLKVDSIYYTDEWYGHDEFRDGGVSLEIIDPENVCGGRANWSASEAREGGSPGQTNSIAANKPDLKGPRLVSASAHDSVHVILTFDEKLEKTLHATHAFTLDPSIEISNVRFMDKTLTRIQMTFSGPLSPGILYTINLSHIYDCAGNRIDQEFRSRSFALPQQALPSDVVINEILFNPKPGGVDFVELYNPGEKYVNLRGWNLESVNMEDATIIERRLLTDEDLIIEPKSFAVFTNDPEKLKDHYPLGDQKVFYRVDLPSFNDDEDNVSIRDIVSDLIDSVSYTEKMHSIFLKDTEGVSLERIEVSGEGPVNWTSASGASGFATPGTANTNSRETPAQPGTIRVQPEIFSPGGRDSFVQINYDFPLGGLVANVSVFDSHGRRVKTLAENEMLGTNGFLRWDGDRDDGYKAGVGYYLIFFESFGSDGKVQVQQKRVAVAADFGR